MSVWPKIIASLSALKESAQLINSLDAADFRSIRPAAQFIEISVNIANSEIQPNLFVADT